jgi:hypothetical protein
MLLFLRKHAQKSVVVAKRRVWDSNLLLKLIGGYASAATRQIELLMKSLITSLD